MIHIWVFQKVNDTVKSWLENWRIQLCVRSWFVRLFNLLIWFWIFLILFKSPYACFPIRHNYDLYPKSFSIESRGNCGVWTIFSVVRILRSCYNYFLSTFKKGLASCLLSWLSLRPHRGALWGSTSLFMYFI